MKANAMSLVLNVLACLALVWGAGCRQAEKSSTHAMQLIQNAGGVDAINKEAKAILARLGGANERVLSGSELKQFPAIAGLGDLVVAYNSAPGFPPHVRVRFGPHQDIHFILIFDPTDPKGPEDRSSLAQLAPNIFVTGK